MQATDSTTNLADELSKFGARLITIDGAHGSGKSTLAKTLAEKLDAKLVEADQFLKRNQGNYIPSLNWKKLAACIDPNKTCILDGICMRQILDLTGLTPDINIYVKRMARWGWADEDELVIDGKVDDHIQQLKQRAAPFFEHGHELQLGLWEEVIRYHAQYLPHEKCNFTFHRSDA